MKRWSDANHPGWSNKGKKDLFPAGIEVFTKGYHRIRPDQVAQQVHNLLNDGAPPPPNVIIIQCGDRELAELVTSDITPLKTQLETMADNILALFRVHGVQDTILPRLFFIGPSPKSCWGIPRDCDGTDRMDRLHANRIKLLDGLANMTLLKPYLFKSKFRQFFVEKEGEVASESELGAQAWVRTILRDVGKRFDWHRGAVNREIFIHDFLQISRPRGPF